MALYSEREKPRIWKYVVFWFVAILPACFLVLIRAEYDTWNQMDFWVNAVLFQWIINWTFTISALYLARILYSYRLVKKPLQAIALGFFVFASTYTFIGVWHIVFWLSTNDVNQYHLYLAGLFKVMMAATAKSSLFAFIILGCVWAVEQSDVLRKISTIIGRYALYFVIPLAIIYVLAMILSPGHP